MADECCNSFGGFISIEVDGEKWSPTEADIVINPSNVEVEDMANQDGSGAFTSKPVLPSAEIKFRKPCGMKWNELMRKCRVNASIVEIDNGRTHLFTAGRIVGKPAVNTKTGEVDGLKVVSPNYLER